MSELKYILIHPDWVEMMLTKDTAEKQVAFIVAIFEYALEGKVPPAPRDLENPRGVDYAARDGYLAAKSNIDFVLSKVRAGSKGGSAGKGASKARPGNQNARKHPKPEDENASKSIAEQKQITSKTQANHKQNASLNININKNINTITIPIKGRSNGNGNGNGENLLEISVTKKEFAELVNSFIEEVKSNRENGGDVFFDPKWDATVMCCALAGDLKSIPQWNHLSSKIPDDIIREELFRFYREIRSGESPKNKGAALNVRLIRLSKSIDKNGCI